MAFGGFPLEAAGGRGKVRGVTLPPMTIFLAALLLLSVAAVLLTCRAVADAPQGLEDAAGFHALVPVGTPREAGLPAGSYAERAA
jgi:hypothetical protein